MNNIKPNTATLVTLALLAILPSCATTVSQLSADGRSDKIIFPDIQKNTWMKEGVFPNIDNLRTITPGMTKDHIYALLGHPHFSEGIGSVREWDYILNFHKNSSAEITTCQYKIIYTTNMQLQNTYWKPESCAQELKAQTIQMDAAAKHVVEKLALAPELIRMKISADGMFDFDKSEIEHLRPGGIEKLNRVSADLLSAGEITKLKIIGYTDRLGNNDYNIKLSKARADTIREYLITKNIPEENISTDGMGESMPLVECSQIKRDEVLIRCLEPNRRFEIEAWTLLKI